MISTYFVATGPVEFMPFIKINKCHKNFLPRRIYKKRRINQILPEKISRNLELAGIQKGDRQIFWVNISFMFQRIRGKMARDIAAIFRQLWP